MKIWQLKSNQCRYVTTDAPPHDCCGSETANNEPYCPAHKKLCHRGTGKDWRALAEVIRLTEKSVKNIGPQPGANVTPGIDEMLEGKTETSTQQAFSNALGNTRRVNRQ